MPKMVYQIADCWQPEMPKRLKAEIDTLMFHRIGPKLGDSVVTQAKDIAAFFRANPDTVDSPFMPYTFVVGPQGTCYQALPILARAPHALKWNRRAISVAVVGDFRTAQPSEEQINACVWLGRRVLDVCNKPLRIVGHTEMPDSSSDPKKVCPGRYFPLRQIQLRILAGAQLSWEA